MPDKYPEIVITLIGGIITAFLLVGFIVAIFNIYSKKKLLQEQEIQSLKTTFEKELIQTRLEIQEEVLKNVSMEIHDNIGQIMLLANINISILQTMQLPPEAPEIIKDTKLMLSKASEDISQLSRSLNSDRITELGVFAAIRHELMLMQQKQLFTAVIKDESNETGKTLPKETQLLVFRMFQEICNNIIKHAYAKEVMLCIEKHTNHIQMTISDDGVGFAFNASENAQSGYNGVGLRSLQSRVGLFRGTIAINSIIDKGTEISIQIPVE